MRAMKRWRDGYKGQKFYVAELDIRHFYDTVDTERLKARLEKIIRDRRYKDHRYTCQSSLIASPSCSRRCSRRASTMAWSFFLFLAKRKKLSI